MQAKTIFRFVGILLALFSLTMLPPVLVAFIYGDGGAGAFVSLLLHHPRYRRRAVAGVPPPPEGVTGTRRLPHRGAVLDGAQPLRRPAVLRHAGAGHLVHQRGVRVLFRPYHHRRHGAEQPRRHAARRAVLSPTPAMAGRHGHHRAGGSGAAHTRRRRHAAVPRRNPRPGQGRQADAAHRRNGQDPVVHLSRPHHRLRRRLLAGRHEPVRRHRPQLLDRRPRRLLDPQRQHRPLQQPRHRS